LQEKDKKKKTEFKAIRVRQPFALNAALAAKRLRPDAVVFGSGISSSSRLPPTLLGMRIALGKTPFILHQLAEFNSEIPPVLLGAGTAFVDKIVCTNSCMHKYFSKAAGNKAVLLLPGLDLSLFPKQKIKKGRKIKIGFFGHFHHAKGPDRLLHAFKQLRVPNAELVFAGTDYEGGAFQKKLRQEIKSMKGVAFFGEPLKPLPLLNSCDFVVLPFRAGGSVLGVSMAAIEAMAAGKPVVGSDVSVLSSIIENGKNGFLVKDDEQLRKAIQLLCSNASLRKKLGNAGRKTVEQRFDISKSAQKFFQICKEVVA
jgi:glycosyltransferase involved in cell wall biosynthesis